MILLDHLILRVSDARASARFYHQTLGLRHEGIAPPFEVLRVDASCTIDLLQEPPHDPVHLAFCVDRQTFQDVFERLQAMDIAFGSGPFVRDGRFAPQQGARGVADALYFHDPDRHNIEARTHDPR